MEVLILSKLPNIAIIHCFVLNFCLKSVHLKILAVPNKAAFCSSSITHLGKLSLLVWCLKVVDTILKAPTTIGIIIVVGALLLFHKTTVFKSWHNVINYPISSIAGDLPDLRKHQNPSQKVSMTDFKNGAMGCLPGSSLEVP